MSDTRDEANGRGGQVPNPSDAVPDASNLNGLQVETKAQHANGASGVQPTSEESSVQHTEGDSNVGQTNINGQARNGPSTTEKPTNGPLTNGSGGGKALTAEEMKVLEIYIDDCVAATSVPSTQSPGTSDYEFSDPNKSESLQWFSTSLGTKKIIVNATADNSHKILPNVISLNVPFPSPITAPPLQFTTDEAERFRQFNEKLLYQDANVAPGRAGHDDRVWGQIMAFKPASTTETINMKDFVALLDFECASWVSTLLAAVTLKPRVFDPTATSPTYPKSAIWYQPEVNHTTTMRIEMEVIPPSVPDALNNFIKSHLASLKKGDFSLGPIYVIGKKTATMMMMNGLADTVAMESELILETSLKWKMDANDMQLNLTARLHESGMSLILQFPPGEENLLEELVTWLGVKVKDAGLELDTNMGANIRDALNSIGSKVWLRQVALSIGENKLLSFKVDFEVPFRFGAPVGSTAALLTSFSWLSGSIFLDAKLFIPLAKRPPIVRKELNPLWESYQDLEPRSPNTIDYLSISHMFDPSRELDGIPEGLPSKITEFSAKVGFGAEKSMRISATIKCDSVGVASQTQPPKIAFGVLDLAASYNFGTKEYGLTLTGAILLDPHPSTKASEEGGKAVLRFSIEHQPGGTWVVSGRFSLESRPSTGDQASKSYKVAHLGNFFTSGGIQKAVINLMSEIQVSSLGITYQYDKGSPSSFIMDGTLWLGEVALKLNYTHRGSSWSFEADLEPEDKTEKVSMKDILKDVLHDFSDVPDFVANMTLPLDQASIKLRCKTAGTPPAKSHVVFSIDIEIKDFYFTFVQIQNHEAAKDVASKPLRMLRFALTKLPTIQSIPLVSKLEQPFDQLGFIWLSEDLMEDEALILNSDVFTNEPLRWKTPKAATPATNGANVVLPMGSHFQIVIVEKQVPNVILDYVFGTKAVSGSAAPAETSRDSAHSDTPAVAKQVAKAPGKGGNAATPSSKTPMTKKQGPLKISNVALKYAGGKLHVLLDAMVKLGPLEFELIGFSIILDISKFSIHDWSSIKIDFSLDGLGVEVKEGKFVLAGLFERIHTDTQTGFAGGLSVDVTAYGFLAAGAYIENSEGFKTVFAFAMLTGPLMEFGWAEVRGITAGFGYNSDLRLPDITQVPEFPLLSHSASKDADPLVQLKSLATTSGEDAWITARDKSIWVAAGLTIKALQILDVQAIVTIELGDDFKIAIIGEAVAQLPRGTDHPFLLLDLDIMASLDVGKGTLQIEAQLSPASFLLDHDCHPTGGFALCAWFKGSEHAGDWVFTVGGFHPLYRRPAHYPEPPRLGISWRYDSHLSIIGGAYFAITPKVCMAGMQIAASYDLGRLSASFDAHADMLMQYQPFQYMVEAGVSMSVCYELKAWGVSHKFYAHASATVSLMGPPMVGSVHVDISVVNFTIAFGPKHVEKLPLTLEQFWASLKQASDSDAKEEKEVDEHIFAITSGLIPSPLLPAKYLGVVRAGNLELQIQSRGALSEATYVYDGRKAETGNGVFAKPMRIGNELTSKLKISISRVGGGQYGFVQAPIKQSLPSALWTAYDERLDPKDKGDNSSSINTSRPSTVEHLMGLSLKPPPPLLSPDTFPAFSVKELMKTTASFPGDLTQSAAANAAFRPGTEKASKEKMRGLWGSRSSNGSFDVNAILSAFGKGLQKTKSDVAVRFMNLKTRPPKKLFDHFDRFYASGAPSLAYTTEKPSFDATIAGRWSMADEKGRSRDESSAQSTVRFPDIFAVGNTPPDVAEAEGKGKRSKPTLIVGLSRIDVQPASDLKFNIEVERVNTDSFQMKVPFEPSSVVDDLEAHWIATYHPEILSGTCKFTDANVLGNQVEHLIIKHITIPFPEGHFSKHSIPVAAVWLTGVHFSKTSPPRVQVSVISTNHKGCNIMFRSWGKDTELHEATCTWIAYPHNHAGISSGHFTTDIVHTPNHPTKETSQVVKMNRPRGRAGLKPPRIVVGLNKIDCAAGRSLRLAVSVGSVGSTSFRAHISTWGYSVLYSAGASWIALED